MHDRRLTGAGPESEPEGPATAPTDERNGSDREQLRAGTRRNRRLDRALARELGKPEPYRGASGTSYLQPRPGAPPVDSVELVERARRGDPGARAALVEAYLPLIAAVARTYRGSRALQRAELLQEGVVGLLRALERYDPGRGVPFWAYASWWVRQAMQQLVAELTHPIVLSDRALRHLARLKDAHRAAVAEAGREPTSEELSRRTGLTDEQVAELLSADWTPRSLDEPVVGTEGAVGTFGELLEDPLAGEEYERVLNAIEAEDVLGLLSGLSDRERLILRARYGLDGEERSLRDLGAELGLSAERVRQLEARALGKLAAGAGAD